MQKLEVDFNEVENELNESFYSFFTYSLELIGKVDENKNNYKFAVVNMQITLELFLKYYFIRKGLNKYVIKEVNSNRIKYKDFSSILNNYFRVNKWTYGRKKELTKILELRNNIVHCGTSTQLNKDVVGYMIRCIFFIHGIMKSEFGELLIADNNLIIKHNTAWEESVEEFIDDLVITRDCIIRTCLSCGGYSVIPKEVFNIGEMTSDDTEDLVCLNCLEVYDQEVCKVIDCYNCVDGSYYIDVLNPQKNQLFFGKCVDCGADTWVRKCATCGRLYHPSEETEIVIDGKYYCSQQCAEIN